MAERLRQQNAAWIEQGLPTITVRMGIHTGLMVAGSLGGKQRIEYAMIGDTVNMASRLESFDKDAYNVINHVCRILIIVIPNNSRNGVRISLMPAIHFTG